MLPANPSERGPPVTQREHRRHHRLVRAVVLAILLAGAPVTALAGTTTAAHRSAPVVTGMARHLAAPPTLTLHPNHPPQGATGTSIKSRLSGPGTGSQLIADPGFELGAPNPHWREQSTAGLGVIDGAKPHSGAFGADLCSYNGCTDTVTQTLTFTVPTGIVSASASFYFWMGTQEAMTTCNDYLAAGLTDMASNSSNGSAAQLCTDWADGAWHQQVLDETLFLQAHAGQQVQVVAQGITDADNAYTRYFVDDFGLTIVTAPGTPTAMLVQPDNSAATISWQAPADGGSPITNYTITPYTNNGTVAGKPVVFNSASTIDVVNGLLNGTAYTFTVSAANAFAPGSATGQSSRVVPDRNYDNEVASTQQYTLQNSDGVHWSDIDANYLSTTLAPATDSLAVVSANVDLWTVNAGYNQDIGITVSGGTYPSASGQPEAWKESGGFAGTFSPNAAFVQTVLPLKAATPYTFRLQWKTNKAAPASTIVAGAGPSGPPFSPIRMTVDMIPAVGTPLSSPSLATAASNLQFQLSGSNGTTWTDLGPSADPAISFTAPDNGLALVSGNADLWTAAGGLNQDLGLTVSGGTYPSTAGQPEAWKESGGFAGTFSPNAAFAQTALPVVKGVTYAMKLQWKTNKPSAANQTILAGAGPTAPFSPTRLTLSFTASGGGLLDSVSTGQYRLTGSDGVSWSDIDPVKLALQITPTNNCVANLSANADLWTANAGFNQDLGIQVSSNLGTFSPDRVGWKESGGFAGTFSPNAAFLQTPFPMNAGTTYTVKLQWKANKNAPGATIFAAAGPAAPFSPTRLTAQLACPKAAQLGIISTPQTLTAGTSSGPMTVQLQDAYGNPVVAGTTGQIVSLTASSSGGSFQDANGVTTTTVTIAAGSSTATFKYRDTVAGSPVITAHAPPLGSGNQTETVVADITAQYRVTAPPTATRTMAVTVTVTAEDKYGNTTPAYVGTVHFTSTDGAALLPGNYAFATADRGSHGFSVTLNTSGAQTVTATDTPNSQITGSSASIVVS